MLRALAKYWEILDYIAGHEDYVGRVAETVKVDLPRVSKAVKELKNYGVVSVNYLLHYLSPLLNKRRIYKWDVLVFTGVEVELWDGIRE